MAGRRIRDATDAEACLAAARESGRPLADWARRAGIDGRSLNAWRINLERGRTLNEAFELPRLVEVVAAPPSAGAGFTIRCGAFAVDLDEGFDEVSLRRLLRVLASC